MTNTLTTKDAWFIRDEHYQNLIEDVKSALVEGSFNERMVKIEMYHRIGEDVRKFSNDLSRNVTATVKAIHEDLNVAERSVWLAVKFYDTYPDISALPEGKAISWSKVKKLLGDSGEEKEFDAQKIADSIIKRYGPEKAAQIALHLAQ